MPDAEVAHRLAQRFLRSLPDKAQAKLVRSLSVPRWFDLALLRDRLDQGEDAAEAAHDTLAHFSFVEPSPDGRLRMHSTMREALEYLLEEEDAARWRELHEWCRRHWEARQPAVAGEAFYHRLHLQPTEAIAAWRDEAGAARNLRGGERCRAALSLWENIDLTNDTWRERMGDEAWADGLQWVAYRLDELRPAAWQHGPVLQQAIRCYEAALRVWTEEAFPADWAMTQNNLGSAYQNLPTGDRAANLQQAIACYEAALRVYTEEAFPEYHAIAAGNLGEARVREAFEAEGGQTH
jgi:tetratricopeptide (TPR) repeat protein